MAYALIYCGVLLSILGGVLLYIAREFNLLYNGDKNK